MSPGCLIKTTEKIYHPVPTHPGILNGFLLDNDTKDHKIKMVELE